MAQAPDLSDKRLEELEEEITDTTLPPGSAEQPQSAFLVERMKDMHGKTTKTEGKMEVMCESCSLKMKAIAFCRQCTAFLCVKCVEQHKTLRVFAGHNVDLEDLKRGGTLNISPMEAPPPKCPDHDEPMKIFCFNCNRLVCHDCVLYDHREHKSDFVKKCATESRKSLRNSLTSLQKVQANITNADKMLIATEAQVDAQEKEVCQTIKQSFAQLKAILEQRETELLNKAVTLAREKKDALTAQRKGLQMAEADTQGLVEFVEQNVENTSDQDLMVIYAQLQARVKQEEKRHQQRSLEPATTADITYDPPPLDIIPRTLGEVLRQSQMPQLCEIGDLASIQLGKVSKMMTLRVPGHQNPTIQAELKSLVDSTRSVQADVTQKGVGIYNITCTPRVRGRHDLTVKVNGKNVGSPFRVFVKIHPTQLGPPVRTISGVSRTWGIALNDKQQLVVAERDGKRVSIMERDGKKMQTIECDKFTEPCGVATGPDRAIYVTDRGAQCLFKFNKEGTLLKTVQNVLKNPKFLKIIKNQLYVSEYDSNLVKIFDTDCNVTGTIHTNECSNTYDIAGGDDGLYVVGGNKIGVYSCAPNGDFIRHLNIKPTSVKLSSPRGMCFDSSGHLFVTQRKSGAQGVHVFTTSGEHLATFGLASSGVSMGCPAGIVVDDDGFVYVCDNSSHNKVVTF